VLKLGLALLVVIVPPGCAGDGTHICAVKTPLAEQDVLDPTMLYPALQVTWQLLPAGRLVGQLPILPFAGGDTEHGPACAEIGRLRSAAAIQTTTRSLRGCLDAKSASTKSNSFIPKAEDLCVFIAVSLTSEFELLWPRLPLARYERHIAESDLHNLFF
jgi:hypothetical protein